MTFQALRILVTQEQLNILILIENKNKVDKVVTIHKKLKFQHLVVNNPLGIAGGLALMWNEEVSLHIEENMADLFDATCSDIESGR